MAEKEENITDTWLKHALIIASKINEETFRVAFKKRGLNDNPSLLEASLAQRLAFGSRLNSISLRRSFGRQQQGDALTPDVVNSELLISGDIERITRGPGAPGGPGAPVPTTAPATPPPYSGMVVAQGGKTDGYGVYFLDNKMYFTINQDGKSYQVATTQTLPAKFSFKAGLQKNGTMQLFVDNKEIGSAKTPGLFKKDLEIPIRVGTDPRTGQDKIADYPDSTFFLRGTNLTNAKLETLESIAPPAVAVGKIDKTIILKVLKDVMKYDKQLLTAKAGTTIQIVVQNPDFMQHNFVLIKPRTTEKVGAAADKLAQDPNGAKMNYVPKMPEVIKATPLINPGGKFTLTIKLPDVPGDYPYVCTFPGHWRIMKGILRVSKSDQKSLAVSK
jgi:azurin